MNSSNQGITINTFFYLAKEAGIDIHNAEGGYEDENKDELPLIPQEVYDNLPLLLQAITDEAKSERERDLLLLGSLVAFSSCIPNVFGFYDRRKVYPNLYLFITAKASAGKGILNHCRLLVRPIHNQYREESAMLKEKYQQELNQYNADKKGNSEAEKPKLPPEKMLFIPANNSATGMFQLLDDNKGKGFIFETEGDTLANTFKSDYGNYSDGFRKAFHHESISYYRRTDREHVEIEKPCLSTLLSGTPKQLTNLIPDVENGLFSRFMFYHLHIKAEWHNVFETSFDNGLDEHFELIGNHFYELYCYLQGSVSINFAFNTEQIERFNSFFQKQQAKHIALLGEDYTATIRRLGVTAFRIAMILSALRIDIDNPPGERITCEWVDFENTLKVIETLLQHSQHVYNSIVQEKNPNIKLKKKDQFFKQLPPSFTRKDYAIIAKSSSIPDKTAQRYINELINDGLVVREKQGVYSIPK